MRKENYRPGLSVFIFGRYCGYFAEKSMVNVEYLRMQYHYLYGIVFNVISVPCEVGVKYMCTVKLSFSDD